MGIYRCAVCDEFIDDDWHPLHITEDGDLCPACYEEQCGHAAMEETTQKIAAQNKRTEIHALKRQIKRQ